MQLIHELEIDAEQYVTTHHHCRIVAPEVCPNCNRPRSLWALGYYTRNLARLGPGFLRVIIRRFRCRVCGKTVSVLPSFAQPYRLVQNETIEKYANGGVLDPDVTRRANQLRRYWNRFVEWVPEMKLAMAVLAGRSPPAQPKLWWDMLLDEFGSFADATRASVSAFQITFFGRYLCHRPNAPAR